MNVEEKIKEKLKKSINSPKENIKINLLIHNDLDGFGCLYFLKKIFKEKNIYYLATNYKEFPIKFNKLSEDLQKNKKDFLIVCDLGLNSKVLKKLNLKNVKEKLLWFDHHIWDEICEKEIKKNGLLLIDISKSTSEIIYDFFQQYTNYKAFDKFDEKLKKTISDIDLWKIKKEESFKLSLALINYDLKKYLAKLEKNKLFDEELEKKFEKNKQKLFKIKSKIEKKGKILKTKRGVFLLSSINSKEALFISHLYELLKEKYDGLILVNENGKVSLRGKVKVNDIAQKVFGGGGHLYAAGGFISYPKLIRILNKIFFKFNIIPYEKEIIKKILEVTKNN